MNITASIAALGPGPLAEDALREHIYPLFSKTLASPNIYLANHSLGRPLDQTANDLAEGFHHWQTKLADAWTPWMAEEQAHRARIAQLIGAERSDCIIPKTSAGQGLRTVLNALPGKPRVLSTTSEFDSIDVILKQYASVGRIELKLVDLDNSTGEPGLSQLLHAIPSHDLVVISQVLFTTGEILPNLDHLAAVCHQHNARLLVDAYHAIGVFPVDVSTLQADFLIGGSYKYLRGGPGACFLYISPPALASNLQPLDIGWFAKESPFAYDRPNPPRFAPGGDAFLESTPAVLTCYQARAGQQLMLALGPNRVRTYTLDRLSRLKLYLAEQNITTTGADAAHGAFLTLHHLQAAALATTLEQHHLITDARGPYLRLSPDLLTPDSALHEAASILASALRRQQFVYRFR